MFRTGSPTVSYCRLLLLLLALSLGFAPGAFADGEDSDATDTIARESLPIAFPEPNRQQEAAFAQLIVQRIRAVIRDQHVDPAQARVFIVFDREPPAYLHRVAEALEAQGIRLGMNGEITVSDIPNFYHHFRRAVVGSPNNESDEVDRYLLEIRELRRLNPDLPEVNREFATAYLDSLRNPERSGMGVMKYVWAVVVPYFNRKTGIWRKPVQHLKEMVASLSFMAISATAAAYQIMLQYPNGNSEIDVRAGVATAGGWRFFFTHFKQAYLQRQRAVKLYNPRIRRVVPSFAWGFAQQILDTLVSAFHFQASLHRGIMHLTPELWWSTFLSSMAVSLAKFPANDWLAGMSGEADKLFEESATSLQRIVADLHRAARSDPDLEADITRAKKLAEEHKYSEYVELVNRMIARYKDRDGEVAFHLKQALKLAEQYHGERRVLFWSALGTDFLYDSLRYGLLAAGAATGKINFCLAVAGIAFMLAKTAVAPHLSTFTAWKDVTQFGGIDLMRPDGPDRLARAVENRIELHRHLRGTFRALSRWFLVDRVVGRENMEKFYDRILGPEARQATSWVSSSTRALSSAGKEIPERLKYLELVHTTTPSEKPTTRPPELRLSSQEGNGEIWLIYPREQTPAVTVAPSNTAIRCDDLMRMAQ